MDLSSKLKGLKFMRRKEDAEERAKAESQRHALPTNSQKSGETLIGVGVLRRDLPTATTYQGKLVIQQDGAAMCLPVGTESANTRRGHLLHKDFKPVYRETVHMDVEQEQAEEELRAAIEEQKEKTKRQTQRAYEHLERRDHKDGKRAASESRPSALGNVSSSYGKRNK